MCEKKRRHIRQYSDADSITIILRIYILSNLWCYIKITTYRNTEMTMDRNLQPFCNTITCIKYLLV